MNRFSKLTLTLMTAIPVAGCIEHGEFTEDEKRLIGNDPEAIMRVLTVDDDADSQFLHRKAVELNPEEVGSDAFRTLCGRMLATVNDPENPGVGIAAPQVGISKRIVAVQRLDKTGEPFEIYVNPRITRYSEEARPGPEGCLSVPDRSGIVKRAVAITIEYLDLSSLETVSEEIEGFTAIIFQHETDHLDGIIYTEIMEAPVIETLTYEPMGQVCPSEINVTLEDGLIAEVEFNGGCKGNSQGMVSLLRGMDPLDAIDRLEGIKCGSKPTSCPDQLSKALTMLLAKRDE